MEDIDLFCKIVGPTAERRDLREIAVLTNRGPDLLTQKPGHEGGSKIRKDSTVVGRREDLFDGWGRTTANIMASPCGVTSGRIVP